MSRYRQMTEHLSRIGSCRRIMEIGTWNGKRAMDLARAALTRNPEVTYVGFDLFEMLTDTDFARELSKRPPDRATVSKHLDKFRGKVGRPWPLGLGKRFDFELHMGYTTDTLPAFVRSSPPESMDFIFIDGGHSIETIENDWQYSSQLVRSGGSVFFDDFYDSDALTDRFGCNSLVRRLQSDPAWNVRILPIVDEVPDVGGIRLVQVERRSNGDALKSRASAES